MRILAGFVVLFWLLSVFLIVPAMFIRMVWAKIRGRYVPFVMQGDTGPGPTFTEAVIEFVVIWGVMVLWTLVGLGYL